jgi:hypothetical protein
MTVRGQLPGFTPTFDNTPGSWQWSRGGDWSTCRPRRQANAAAAAFVGPLATTSPARPTRAPTTDAVRDYFHLRQAYEAQRWAALDTGKLDRFRALRLRFNTVLDPLYARWELYGDAVLEEVPASAREWPPRLETIVLPHSYAALEPLGRRS